MQWIQAMETLLKLRDLDKIADQQTVLNNSNSQKTTREQIAVERTVLKKFSDLHATLTVNQDVPLLSKHQHKLFLSESLRFISSKYEILDASRTWICYWLLHPLTLMGVKFNDGLKSDIVQFLAKCQSPSGGFAGGPGQCPHLAPTYAAVNALVIVGTEEAYKIINRKALYEFLQSLKQPDGSFAMHIGGEIDIRGAYCAIAVASITDIITRELVSNTAEWIAHGGYAFCGLAALVILNKGHLCDNRALLRWLVHKQMPLEGGFQGRTNKLVDSCYSFWQGGAFPLLYTLLAKEGCAPKRHLFDERALQEYILICCQYSQGGLIDKPGKPRDSYHSCYAISGLSVAQHFLNDKHILGTYRNELYINCGSQRSEPVWPDWAICRKLGCFSESVPLDNFGKMLASTHPLYNIRPDLVRKAMLFFHGLQS
ncbi:hypothetical protein HUJ05_007588 [Dendroctonus ponderosae]|nr:hypothetical protein HUJ05_007588 [Dendroctonus ponderosae]